MFGSLVRVCVAAYGRCSVSAAVCDGGSSGTSCWQHQHARRFSQQQQHQQQQPSFAPQRVLVLKKVTRLEYERTLHPHLPEDRLKEYLKKKGSDYDNLLLHHNIHHSNLNSLVGHLQQRGVDCQVVSRSMYTHAAIDWADAVVAAGGDGTFLLAASSIKSSAKPVVGVNTDPGKSEGHLCMPSNRTVCGAIDALLAGRFRWLWRQRIRVSMTTGLDKSADDARLQSMHLKYPEYRYSEHFKELEEAWLKRQHPPDMPPGEPEFTTLPVFALNEVFIGESLSARVSYYEIGVGRQGRMRKQKSSGVTVCTGTGSTSWYFHINHLSESQVEEILHYANQLSDSAAADVTRSHRRQFTPAEIGSIARSYNSALTYDPERLQMGWAVRDPVVNSVFAADPCRGTADWMRVRSRMWDAKLVIDGDCAFAFNDGCIAVLEMRPEDALCCVKLLD